MSSKQRALSILFLTASALLFSEPNAQHGRSPSVDYEVQELRAENMRLKKEVQELLIELKKAAKTMSDMAKDSVAMAKSLMNIKF